MKLATYRDGSRDGQLVVVSRDLSTAHYASGMASRLQQALDDWNFIAPQLQDLAHALNQGKARHAFPFDPAQCMAPLPRVPRRVGAQVCLTHVERLCASTGRALPARLQTEPQLAAASGDLWLGPLDDVHAGPGEVGLDLGPEIAVLCGDIAQGASPEQALEGVRLVMLVNDWAQREVLDPELARLPPSAAPVALSLDELGEAWSRGRAALRLRVQVNARPLGELDTAADAQFHFGQLLSLLARHRRLSAGTMVGTGVIASPQPEAGAACLLDQRAIERERDGQAVTPWLRDGDSVRIEAFDAQGRSLFGAIDQSVLFRG
ncbi:fumarylacetoacetate (FAA) hydrolase [Sphaerotilus hippei]|uniref:Fumarylacetoacetate (FAA) hydrolase n=1 Tax=Sphaerotilus hippei TaxID=744406 RepID=A0A318GW64_9BURK|nr:fumarylacetoacetate hydrolase family protein [Sphaerotilus hippei]PXW93647.1 fumarylacetoacetate (FAA) hydrolase [Sphaerotilus hippei]